MRTAAVSTDVVVHCNAAGVVAKTMDPRGTTIIHWWRPSAKALTADCVRTVSRVNSNYGCFVPFGNQQTVNGVLRCECSVTFRLTGHLQISECRPDGLTPGVVADHAAVLFPATLALDLVGGRAVLGHAAGHVHSPAVATEELPVDQSSGPGNHLDPPGDLRFRQPEYPLIAVVVPALNVPR